MLAAMPEAAFLTAGSGSLAASVCSWPRTVESAEPAIAYWKHQSAWETLAQLLVFPKQSWVLKRELMWIPLIGQALMSIKPIPIDRASGHTAVNQVLNYGSERLLKDGLVVRDVRDQRVERAIGVRTRAEEQLS